MRMMNTAARDATSIVSRLRESYRQREEDEVFSPVRLEQLAGEALSLTQPRWKDQAQARGVRISVQDEMQEAPLVAGNASDLREMLTNLIFNAVDAMPDGGTLTVRTRYEASSNDDLSHSVLEVSDTGVGMPAEVRTQCMDPFFTTKEERGTGLGLAMVHGIVRRHGGSIDVKSEEGAGTTFLIRLPALTDEEAKVCEADELSTVSRSLRVLLVEDEDPVRDLTAEYLLADGHHVETAINGREGVEKYRVEAFDLVITDRAMPELGGDEVAAEIKRQSPGQKVMMLTGFGGIMHDTGDTPADADLVLAKPIGLKELRRALRELIDA